MAGRPTVDEVSAPYANFMRTPAPAGPDVCRVCRTFTDGYPTCYRGSGDGEREVRHLRWTRDSVDHP